MESSGIKDSRFAKMMDAWNRWRGNPVETDLAPYLRLAGEIRKRGMRGLDEAGLEGAMRELGEKARRGIDLDELLVEAYALVGEAARRALGLDPFDVQLVAAIALHRGRMVEMPTGEGKTLVAVFPAALHALVGRGVHVFTANDYLARRDAAWMGPVYRLLGLRADFVQEGMEAGRRRQAYGAEVTYLAAREAGFDFLRDHLCLEPEEVVQREFHLAIVDEADFILVDEARVPLVIAGEEPLPPCDPLRLAWLISRLEPGADFGVDANGRNVFLAERGIRRLEKWLECGNLYSAENQPLLTGVNLALHARALLRRDVDYIVRGGEIEIVDEFTGRVADRRRWPDGIQQAVEAREGLAVQPEGKVLGSITLQHFVRLYPRLCGMTATAVPAADELFERYGMKTVVVPPNRPCLRIDHPDRVYADRESKLRALVEEVAALHATGRPVLVGTASVAESELLAFRLAAAGVRCAVLNAKNDEQEARVVSGAGALHAVTISTNLAGRGTDIRLGGADGRDRGAVSARGGLCVIGANRHESRRVDLQLRGRAGRQGDPGSSCFFVSPEDDLLLRYGIRDLAAGRGWKAGPDGRIASPQAGRDIDHIQRVIEGQNAAIRRTLHQYTSLLEEQRGIVCGWREEILFGASGGEATARRARLLHLDRLWAEHLSKVADIRENIHLFRLAGRVPLEEYHKRIVEEFCPLQEQLGRAVAETLARLGPAPSVEDLAAAGLRGPSSTWVYLVNDDPFSEMFSFLISNRHIGVAAAAPMPLLLPLLLLRRFGPARRGGAGKPFDRPPPEAV